MTSLRLLKFMFCIIVSVSIRCQTTDEANEVETSYQDESEVLNNNNILDIPFDSNYLSSENVELLPEMMESQVIREEAAEVIVEEVVDAVVVEEVEPVPEKPRVISTLTDIPLNSVILRNINGVPLTAEDNGELSLNREEPTDWEHWTVEKKGGRIAFKSHHGKYLSAQTDGSFVANRLRFGPWEAFELIQHVDNNINKISEQNADSKIDNLPVNKLLIRTSHRKYMVLSEEAVEAITEIPASSLSLQRASDDRSLYSEDTNKFFDKFGI